MKKLLLLFMTAAVIFGLSSCDEQEKKKDNQKDNQYRERHEKRRW